MEELEITIKVSHRYGRWEVTRSASGAIKVPPMEVRDDAGEALMIVEVAAPDLADIVRGRIRELADEAEANVEAKRERILREAKTNLASLEEGCALAIERRREADELAPPEPVSLRDQLLAETVFEPEVAAAGVWYCACVEPMKCEAAQSAAGALPPITFKAHSLLVMSCRDCRSVQGQVIHVPDSKG